MLRAYTDSNVSHKINQQKSNQDLIYAICEYDMEAMLQAMEDGADLNANDTLGIDNELLPPPVVAAIEARNLPALKILLKRGAEVTATSAAGAPALLKAIVAGSFEIVDEMLRYKANPNTYHGRTGLHAAVENLPSLAVIRYSDWSVPKIKEKLLAWYNQTGEFAPDDPSDLEGIPFPEQSTPLRASYEGSLEIIPLLLSHGAQPWVANVANVSVLDILEDPLKYKRYFARGEGKFLGSTDKDILTFEMELVNRNDSSRILKVIVDYNLKEIKNRIQTHMKFSAQHAGIDVNERLGSQLSHVQTQLEAQKQKLTEVHAQTALLALPKVQRAEWDAWINAASHENLATFYHFIVTKFENIIMSFKAVDGGQINPKEGKVAAIGGVLGNISDVVSIVPLVGDAVEKIFKCMEAVLKKIDEGRELNTAKQVGKINYADVLKEGPILARMLTAAFAQQLLELPTPKEAQAMAQRSSVKKGLNQLNALVLKGQFIPPAEVEAMVAMTWVVEFLYETPNIAEQIREKGLATVFFTAIIGQNPPERVNAFWSTFSKKMGGISTKSGETWNSEDMYVYTGIRTQEGNFCVHAKSKPDTYGWRLITVPILTELTRQFELTPVPTPNKLPAAYLRELKIPQSPYAKKLTHDSASSNDSSTDNSLHLPMPPVSATQATPLTFRKPDSKEGKEAAETLQVPAQQPQPNAGSRALSPVAARSSSPSPGPTSSRTRLLPKGLFGKLVSTAT